MDDKLRYLVQLGLTPVFYITVNDINDKKIIYTIVS